jgi:hypothetical protein
VPSADAALGKRAEADHKDMSTKITKCFTAFAAGLAAVVISFGLIGRASVLNVPSNTWAPTGDMTVVRAGASAVLLYDGRVLVTGGLSEITESTETETHTYLRATASGERFSPTGGSFLDTPPMQSARANHTSTLLPDGRVLVVGGVGADEIALSSVEIYDPATNSWMAGTPLHYARSGHTATPLYDGRVVIAGGNDGATSLDSIEVYDVDAGIFTLSNARLPGGRTGHATVLLYDGTVFITGGISGTNLLDSTVVYDPWEDTLAPGPSLGAARAGHSATTLLDGKVLVAGGAGAESELASGEIYDSGTNSFSGAANSMIAARQRHQAILLPHNNQVLIVGGTAGGNAVATAEVYVQWQGSGGSFYPTNATATTRAWAAASALSQPASLTIRSGPNDGLMLLTGGSASSNGSAPTNSAELYGFATVTTDWADYTPGTTVTITGSGWVPDETVTMVLREVPDVHPDRTLTAVADQAGNIRSTDFAPEEHDLGVKFYLTATGEASQAQTAFTDGPSINTSTVVVCTSATVSTNGTVDCTATVTPQSGTTAPTGPVAWGTSPNNKGTFDDGHGNSNCTLTSSSGTSSSCTVTYRPPSTPLTVTITATAQPDAGWKNSNGAFSVQVQSQQATTLNVNTAAGTYGGTVNLSATLTSGASGVSGKSISFTLNGNPAGSATTNSTGIATLSNVPISGINAGTYATGIGGRFAGDSSFASNSGTASLTVNRATLTVTPDEGRTKTYGTQFTTFTGHVDGLVNGDQGTASYASAGAAMSAGVGEYDITSVFTFTQGSAANYDVHTNTAVKGLKVNPATLTVAPDGGKTKAYGTEFTTFTGHVDGLVNGDQGTPSYASVGAAIGVGVGEYDITSGFTFTQGSWANYDVHTNTAVKGLKVNPATLTVTPDGGKTKTYGTEFTTFTGHVDGLVNGDQGTSSYASVGAAIGVGVGEYDITSGFTFTQGSGANYDVHTNTAVKGLKVNPATLTVTPDGGKTKTYGTEFTAFTGRVDGLANGDQGTPSYASVGAAIGVGVGEYDITSGFTFTQGSRANYDVHTNTAVKGLKVNPATLTVTPDAGKTKILGQTFTAFTGTVSGLVNGDTGTASYSSPGAVASAGVGEYDITSGFAFTQGSAANYDVHTNTAVKGLNVIYANSGTCFGEAGHRILQPINVDDTSVFKKGSTVPAKFRVCDANGVSVGSQDVVTAFKLLVTEGGLPEGINETVTATTPDTQFRWSATDQQWIFNISTKNLSANYRYTYRIWLRDGSMIDFKFGLK